jgi:SpoIID/LytB domain protein
MFRSWRTPAPTTLIAVLASFGLLTAPVAAAAEELPPASGTPSDPWADDPWAEFAGTGDEVAEDDGGFGIQSFSTTSSMTPSSSGPVRLPSPAPILAHGGGWGHGIGMSQYGAQAMATAGRTFAQILTHYHQNTAVQTHTMPNDFRVALARGNRATASNLHWTNMPVRATTSPVTWSVCTSDYGGCTPVETTQRAGETWTAGFAGGRLILRNDDDVRFVDDANANHLRAQLGTGSTPVTVHLAQKGDRPYQWGALEVRRPTNSSSNVRATVAFTGSAEFEKYVRGIAEVPFSWHMEALKAQAVAARSYAAVVTSLDSRCNCHLTDGPENQVYYGADRENGHNGNRWVSAVDSTARRVLTHNSRPIATYYSSSHHTRSENIEDVWGTASTHPAFPAHRSVSDPWSSAGNNPFASWTANLTNSTFASLVGGMSRVTYVRVLERTQGGTPKTIEVHGRTSAGDSVSRTFSGARSAGGSIYQRFGLRSAQIDVLTPSPYEDTQEHRYRSHVYDIAQLARMGVTTGCGPTKYCPSRSVTRGEMAAFLHRTAGEPVPPRRHSYPDVSRDDFYDTAVSWLQAQEITDGYGNTGRYEPGVSVTRGQMVTFLWRMAGEPRPARRHTFPDVSSSRYYDQAVSWASEKGITDGWGDTGRFEPDRVVTRAQMASFLVRYVEAVH